jgi:hypothetical protein
MFGRPVGGRYIYAGSWVGVLWRTMQDCWDFQIKEGQGMFPKIKNRDMFQLSTARLLCPEMALLRDHSTSKNVDGIVGRRRGVRRQNKESKRNHDQ